MTARDPDALVERAGPGDPDRDQHFLVDDRVLDRLPSHLDVAGADVLEVGAGTGALTDRLLDPAAHVTAVERDPALADFLRREFADERAAGQLTIVEGDVLEVDLPDFDASVSNLPYGVSTPVTFRLLPRGRPLLLMYQREVAERLAAEPGTPAYGRLSVAAQHYADVAVVETVPATAFDPQPRVESAVVLLTPRDPDYAVPDEDAFLDLVKAMFTQRRKTVRNAIRNTAHISGLSDPDGVVAALDAATLDRRPDALAPAEFAAIAVTAADVERED